MSDRWADPWLRAVLAVHALLRIGLWLAAVPVQTLPLTGYWQVADLALLRAEPLTTLWHLHAQPPLWNATVALVQQLPSPLHHPVLRLLLAGAGLATVVLVHALARRLGVRGPVAAVVALLVSISPTLVGYELFAFYTLPVAAMVVAVAWLADRSERDPARRARVLLLLAGVASTVALTRSLFHLAWVLAVVGLAMAWPGTRPSPRVLAAALLPVLLVVGWYGRVAALTGEFTSSTWLGMSLAKVTVAHLDPDDLAALVASGEVAPIALRPPFQAPYHYGDLVELPGPTGVAVLDRVATSNGIRNLHHAGVPAVSAAYAEAAQDVVAHRPGVLATQASRAVCFLLRPGHASTQVAAVYEQLDGWRRAWDRVVLLQARPDTSRTCELGSWSAAGLASTSPTAFVLLVAPLWLGAAAVLRRLRGRQRPGDLALAVMAASVGWVVLVSTALEVGENYRFRFLVEPLGWVALAVVVERLLGRLAARRGDASEHLAQELAGPRTVE